MDDLKKSINIINMYNSMEFDDFVDYVRKHTNVVISDDDVETYKFTGLNNVDFFKMYVLNDNKIN